MIRLLANNRSQLSIIVKTLNHCYVNTVIQSGVAWEAKDADLNPVFLMGFFWRRERGDRQCLWLT